MSITIETKDLNIFYGQNQAIKNVSLAFKKNEITALIGPSGCGKSTYLRALNLINREIVACRIEGEIFYNGRNINTPKEDVYALRKNIGMVFQRPNPFSRSIYDNIAFPLKRHGMTNKQELDEIVETSLIQASLWNDVKDELNKSALALSGGQQQRLCIARALAMKPDVLLMDEPTSALDPVSSGAIEDVLAELKDMYTIIIVTHNMQQAARISTETAFFLSGEVIEFDKTSKIFRNPTHQKTEEYISGRFG
ncbi:phosphate ABC transporter ATP-binding protein [Granulicatella sp. zg-ZJ]|uniref:phosphate ABC transporter ATP-binding protein PstB n=1 Tax=unclassified Granulicatella TaxID=2630493 RepID=UPI0013BF80F5|nr:MULTISPECIES: phosphate ABC transporter ATP-binding protein PstB [unclassified Granulicatella]MBS4750754.1 phosphate ABC transporter ATP-binding protein [Carnobacteriaceae bacterium zg-ZUI78]NEW62594.1 phosphate ABC transporter ATP-binding protein [Granulicatella sp. zg-ZJ]NEW66699.1 phosphate ABC transporter ATP-binding protein [Granulicatella sp. zg-84]QMI85994.1 phosphate ABC transporter ATP-binding protein [Carnobacteriaceae bacterium zg-84]